MASIDASPDNDTDRPAQSLVDSPNNDSPFGSQCTVGVGVGIFDMDGQYVGVRGDNVGSSDGDTVGTLVVGEGVGARVMYYRYLHTLTGVSWPDGDSLFPIQDDFTDSIPLW